MRDIVFTLLMLGLIPAAYRRPLIGLLTFSWLAYMRAQDQCWGFARAQRWSFLFAGLTLSGWLVTQRKGSVIMNGRSWAMIALAVLVGISLLLAPTSAKFATNKYIEFCKIVGVALFTTALVTRKEHLRVLLWVIALSFGFYGLKIGIAGVLSGGGFHVMQGPGGMLEDNNDFALALNMGLPFLAQIGASEKNKVLKRWFYAIVPLQILTVLMTHSRGGLLALIALALVLLWRSKNRVAGFTLLFVAGIISLPLMPDEFFDRMGTIKNYEEDGSALGRLAAWKTAINMAVSNPILGVGLSRFKASYMQYASGFEHETARATHNAYLQIWAECGRPRSCSTCS